MTILGCLDGIFDENLASLPCFCNLPYLARPRGLAGGQGTAPDPLGQGRAAGQGASGIPAAANGPQGLAEPERAVAACLRQARGRAAPGQGPAGADPRALSR